MCWFRTIPELIKRVPWLHMARYAFAAGVISALISAAAAIAGLEFLPAQTIALVIAVPLALFAHTISRLRRRRRLEGRALELQRSALARQGHQVFLLNDDHTPVQFVVGVLERFFKMPHGDAVATVLHIHFHGEGVCGVYDSAESAQAKVNEVLDFVRSHAHSLRCVLKAGGR